MEVGKQMRKQKKLSQLHEKLFVWWRAYGRVLPWREKEGAENLSSLRDSAFVSYFAHELKRDPYRVIVSEIMLQQTQVDRVVIKYTHWMEKWPSTNDLSRAKLSEIIVEWKGLGYNRRARFVWLLAKEIVENRNGVWPQTEKELMKLPGIGRYTARAVMSFCFGEQVGVVDTNVKRILDRIFYDKLSLSERDGEKNPKIKPESIYFQQADEILPTGLADPWNQALMDFGALVCTAKKPKCDECPVSQLCEVNVIAMGKGFRNYAQMLDTDKTIELKKKKSTRGKDYRSGKKMKFEETDRFLRGRIVDALREKEWNRDELVEFLNKKYTQFNLSNIQKNISKLEQEKLIEFSEQLSSF